MKQISPEQAARLCERVYRVKEQSDVAAALVRSGLIPGKVKGITHRRVLQAETGIGLARKKDAFALSSLVRTTEGSEDLVIAFRGTFFKSVHDLLTNVDAGVRTTKTGKRAHVGFARVFETLVADLQRVIPQSAKAYTIHVMGHSLGGAIATLAADWISANTSHHVLLYTFGSPRVGLESYAKQLTQQLPAAQQHRLFHETDPVATVPIYPFAHAPWDDHGIPIASKSLGLIEAHKMTKYVDSVVNKGWEPLEGMSYLNVLERKEGSFSRKAIIQNFILNKTPFILTDTPGIKFISEAIAGLAAGKIDGYFVQSNIWVTGSSTIADGLSRVFKDGITRERVMTEGKTWFFLLLKKIAHALGMKIKEKITELKMNTIRQVFDALMLRIRMIVEKALHHLAGQL